MKIIVGADIAVTDSHKAYFSNGEIENVLDEKIINIINSADYRIYNLETPLTNKENPIKKCGPNLIANETSINLLKKLKPNLFLLANNHILDQGLSGLENTIKILNNNNIYYTGIVSNSKEQYNGFLIKKDNKKIGIYNVCEHEFSVATSNSKGANALELIKNCKEIQELKQTCDFVIVIFHGGKEFYRYPSPKLQEICHYFVDFGADYVIVQHSHCIGAEEIYKNKHILYGQGNFIFDRRNDEYWNSELLIELDVKDKIDIKYYPIEKINGKYYLSDDDSIMTDFINRSENIKKVGFIEKQYNDFSNQYLKNYLTSVSGNSLYTKILNKLTNKNYILNKYSKKNCLAILNFIECEAHRELFIQGLKENISNGK